VKAGVIGGGSWGSAFARYLGDLGLPVRLWIREEDVFGEVLASRENRRFLPGFRFPENVSFTRDPADAASFGEVVFFAVPAQFSRSVMRRAAPGISSRQTLISLTKGIEERSLKRMTEIMAETIGPYADPTPAVLSGPSFAREVALGHPTAVVLACKNRKKALRIQALLSGIQLRVYVSRDVAGVEVAGAVKNVIAIAAGISDGLEFGHNSRAALITRGIVEMKRLGVALGGCPETFAGLAGIGDLVLTCTGDLSRNKFVGMEIGRGRPVADILAGMAMVAEGVRTTRSIRRLAEKAGVEMPICEQVDRVLYRRKSPRRALVDLMSRSLKNE